MPTAPDAILAAFSPATPTAPTVIRAAGGPAAPSAPANATGTGAVSAPAAPANAKGTGAVSAPSAPSALPGEYPFEIITDTGIHSGALRRGTTWNGKRVWSSDGNDTAPESGSWFCMSYNAFQWEATHYPTGMADGGLANFCISYNTSVDFPPDAGWSGWQVVRAPLAVPSVVKSPFSYSAPTAPTEIMSAFRPGGGK